MNDIPNCTPYLCGTHELREVKYNSRVLVGLMPKVWSNETVVTHGGLHFVKNQESSQVNR